MNTHTDTTARISAEDVVRIWSYQAKADAPASTWVQFAAPVMVNGDSLIAVSSTDHASR